MPPDELKEIIAIVRAREQLRAIASTMRTIHAGLEDLMEDPKLRPEIEAAAADMIAAMDHLAAAAAVLNARMDNLA